MVLGLIGTGFAWRYATSVWPAPPVIGGGSGCRRHPDLAAAGGVFRQPVSGDEHAGDQNDVVVGSGKTDPVQ